MHSAALGGILLLLALGLPLALLAQRLGMSSMVAYLGAGAVASAFGIIESNDVALLSEIGSTLLLFVIGLEMDLRAMRSNLRQILTAAVGQLGLTVVAGWAMMRLAGMDTSSALAIGCALALSSTLVVLRALDERGLRDRREGQTVIGLLLSQDLCLPILLLLVASVLPGSTSSVPWFVQALGAVAVIGVTVLLRGRLGTTILSRIFAARLPELEVATAITVGLGAAYLTDHLGLGAAIGAFCAGVAMGSDAHRHAVDAAMKPLEGLMAIIFFTAIGLQFDAAFVLEVPHKVFGALLVSVLVKAPLAALALRLSGLSWKAAIGCGLMVGQMGEFGFVLANSAYQAGQGPLSQDAYKLVVAVACLSLAATPWLVRWALPLLPRSPLEHLTGRSSTIVVAGLGPVGNTVVSILHHDGHPLLLVDRNAKLLEPWRNTALITCLQAGIEHMETWMPTIGARPRAVVLTFPVADTSALVAERLLALDPELVIVARCAYTAQIPLLHAAGVEHVLCDEETTAQALVPLLETAIELAPEANTMRNQRRKSTISITR